MSERVKDKIEKIERILQAIEMDSEEVETSYDAAELWEQYGPSLVKSVRILSKEMERMQVGFSGLFGMRKFGKSAEQEAFQECPVIIATTIAKVASVLEEGPQSQ